MCVDDVGAAVAFIERPCNGAAALASGQACVGACKGGVQEIGIGRVCKAHRTRGKKLTYSNPTKDLIALLCCVCCHGRCRQCYVMYALPMRLQPALCCVGPANTGAGSVQALRERK